MTGCASRRRRHGTSAGAAILRLISEEEVGHVAVGRHGLGCCCERCGLHPERTFLRLSRRHLRRAVKGLLHREAYRRAGCTEVDLEGPERPSRTGGGP